MARDRRLRAGFSCVLLLASAVTVDSVEQVLPQLGDSRIIEFETEVGTWMSVDPSPDGRWIAFDLLAQVYRLPAAGGEATCLTGDSGVALNFHPRYSPDGRSIAFISDRAGQENLWLMEADGSNPRLLWSDVEARHSQPAWMPDGRSLIIRRQHFSELAQWRRDNALWQVFLDGGEPRELVGAEVPQASWPAPAADGRHLYFQVFLGDDLPFGRASTLDGYWQLRRLDLETGQTVNLNPGISDQQARSSSGGAFAPEISPDGRWLSFGRQIPDGTSTYRGHAVGPRTALWLRDLETGSERIVMDPIEKDLTEATGALRVLPGYGWSQDGQSIVISQGGRIRRLEVESGRVETVPFRAAVHRDIAPMARAQLDLSATTVRARAIRWPTISAPRTQLAFEALGRIWIRSTLSGTIRRLTAPDFEQVFEYSPTWSPDGRWLAFVTSEGRGGGHVWIIDTTGLKSAVRLSTTMGDFQYPVWSPDGRSLVVSRGSGATARGRGMLYNGWFDLVRFPVAGGTPTVVTTVAAADWDLWDVERRQVPRASFGPQGRLYFLDRVVEEAGDGEEKRRVSHFLSVASDGSDRRLHLRLPEADDAVISPDGKQVLYQEADKVYLTSLPPENIDEVPLADRRGKGWPVELLSPDGGQFPRWVDGRSVEYGNGPTHSLQATEGEAAETVELELSLDRPQPEGRVAIANARLITCGPLGVVEKGSILVQGRRILCVGECGVQGADWVIDATGRTIIPGLIDAHVHNNFAHRGMPPPINPEAAAYLALGVTTVMEPSAWSQNVFPVAELIESGRMLGPRTLSTGDPLFRGDGDRHNRIGSLEDAAREIDRRLAWGATAIKEYRQPLRRQRQWIAEIARQRGLMLTAEGAGLVDALSRVMDGFTGWEHALPYAPVYDDVARFFGAAGATYSPTLGVAGTGPWNEEYFLHLWPPLNNPRLRAFVPWREIAPVSRRTMDRPKSDYSFALLAEGVEDLLDAGGNAAIGSHGQQHGVAPHWEIWMLAEALGPVRALEVATLGGARFLGLDRDLGSLERGKIADLVILESNPLEDIHNTLAVDLVMKDGVAWYARDLVEAWPEPGAPLPFVADEERVLNRGSRAVEHWDQE